MSQILLKGLLATLLVLLHDDNQRLWYLDLFPVLCLYFS